MRGFTDAQLHFALHMHHSMTAILEELMMKKAICVAATGIEDVTDYSMCFKFQDRGTLHMHVVAWVKLQQVGFADMKEQLIGISSKEHNSKLVRLLKNAFRASLDVQAGRGQHGLLSYVTGYVSKNSDALSFTMVVVQSGANMVEKKWWRQMYRMMCKKTPLEPEIALDFAGKSLMVTSYCGEDINAPIQGSKEMHHSLYLYLASQQEQATEGLGTQVHGQSDPAHGVLGLGTQVHGQSDTAGQ